MLWELSNRRFQELQWGVVDMYIPAFYDCWAGTAVVVRCCTFEGAGVLYLTDMVYDHADLQPPRSRMRLSF